MAVPYATAAQCQYQQSMQPQQFAGQPDYYNPSAVLCAQVAPTNPNIWNPQLKSMSKENSDSQSGYFY